MCPDSYNMVWSNLWIDEIWERNWREKGEGERKENGEIKHKGGLLRGLQLSPTTKKICPKKLAYQEN